MPGQNYLDRFWQAAKELPQWADHPLAQERSLSRLVPLSIHGDETPILSKGKIWSSSALIFSWTSLLSNIFALGTKASQLYIWAAWHRSFNKQTNDDFFAVLLWSLEACRFPHRDWRGLAFEARPQSWAMACRWVARHSGGQLWRLGLHVAVSGWNSNSLCCLCQCQKRGAHSWHELNGGQQHGPLLPGGTGRIEA